MKKILPEEKKRTIYSEVKQKLHQENFLVELGLSPLLKDYHPNKDYTYTPTLKYKFEPCYECPFSFEQSKSYKNGIFSIKFHLDTYDRGIEKRYPLKWHNYIVEAAIKACNDRLMEVLVISMKHVFDDSRANRNSDMIIGGEDSYSLTAEDFLKKLSETQNKGFIDSIVMVHPCIYNQITSHPPYEIHRHSKHLKCKIAPHYGMLETKPKDKEEPYYISYILKKYCLTAKFNIKRCESFEEYFLGEPRFQIDVSAMLKMPGYETIITGENLNSFGKRMPLEAIPVVFIQSKI